MGTIVRRNTSEAMSIPPASDPRWDDLLSGKLMPDFDFLALKILVGTVSRKMANDPSGVNFEKYANELREFFTRNADLPPVQRDLRKIFQKPRDQSL